MQGSGIVVACRVSHPAAENPRRRDSAGRSRRPGLEWPQRSLAKAGWSGELDPRHVRPSEGRPHTKMEPPLSWWSLAALAAVLLLLILSVHSARNDARLAKRQQAAIGTIDGHDPSNHHRYRYTFSVNGRQFAGWAYPDKRDFFVGQRIVVYYDPIQPSENSAYDFSLFNPGGVVFIGFALFACVFFPFFIYFQRRSRKRASARPIST
jgi:hypothetical protein